MTCSLFLVKCASISKDNRALNRWKAAHHIGLMRFPNKFMGALQALIASRELDEPHLKDLMAEVKFTGTMHKGIELVVWLTKDEDDVPPAGEWDFSNKAFCDWLTGHHVDPVCGHHSSVVCKSLSDPITGAHPIKDIEQPWCDVMCVELVPENITFARAFGMRDNRRHDFTQKMHVGNRLQHIHREYYECKARHKGNRKQFESA